MNAPAPARRQPRLRGAVAARKAPTDLMRLCAGHPVALEADLIEFLNSDFAGLDPEVDPDDYQLSELLLDWFHSYYGVERRAGGERTKAVADDISRYVLPYVLEIASAREPAQRGIVHLRLQHVSDFPRILAGDVALPAATVAGDRLKRKALNCIWLTIHDAGDVCVGGEMAVREALTLGDLTSHQGNGVELVRAIELRDAGLLMEPGRPHGLDHDTATRIVKLIGSAAQRGELLGAHLIGQFALRSIKPLDWQRKRAPRGPQPKVPMAWVATVCAYLSPTHQIAMWLMRLVGLRIGEAYGLSVTDFHTEGDSAFLKVQTQGGQISWVRGKDGYLVAQENSPQTKTEDSTRTVPICPQLASLLVEVIRVFHTDAVTGEVEAEARLIPGIRSDDDSGIAALHAALKQALRAAGRDGHQVINFTPHDLRAAVITDLAGAKADDRLSRWYVGHGAPIDVHEGYDRGPEDLRPVAQALTDLVKTSAPGLDDLRIATTKIEQWGKNTRRGRNRVALRAELMVTGWLVARSGAPKGALAEGVPNIAVVESSDLARRAGVSLGTARRWMREGVLPAHTVTWLTREVWVSYEPDVDALLAQRGGITIPELATEIGWTYHQVWTMLRTLGRFDSVEPNGAAIRLAPADVAAVRAEVERRVEASAKVVLVSEAAQRLSLEVVSVETLLRQGELTAAPAPDGTRHRYVTLASVESFLVAHPPVSKPAGGELVVPLVEARRALGASRPQMTQLVTSRQLVATTVRGRQHITLASAQDLLARHPERANAADLVALAVAM